MLETAEDLQGGQGGAAEWTGVWGGEVRGRGQSPDPDLDLLFVQASQGHHRD